MRPRLWMIWPVMQERTHLPTAGKRNVIELAKEGQSALRQNREILWRVILGLGWAALYALSDVPTAGAAPSFRPLASGEKLTYKLLWPSGVSLGEAVLEASPAGAETHFQVTVEIDLPQFAIRHTSSSAAVGDALCSLRFRQETDGGGKKWGEESIAFDQAAHEAHRTRDGQTTTASIAECAQDPLTFIYFFRSRLAEGKPLASGALYRGGNFNVNVKEAGTETVEVRGQPRPAEKFVITYPGPNQEATFEVWLSPDAERVPLRMRVPSPLAVFTAELE